MNIKDFINWKLYFALLAASALSILAIMPFILTLQADVLKAAPMPLPLVLLVIVIQSVLFFAVFIFIGLRMSKKLGLQIPVIEKWVAKKKLDIDVRSIMKTSVSLGILSGILIISLDHVFTQLGMESLFERISVPIWQGFLASFYGGISEEIVMRLFFMTLILWVVSRLTKSKNNVVENNVMMWSSIILAALLFGVGHLPITATLTTLTPLLIVRALLLNGIGGVVFGWLYWKKGLESAMMAHFSADMTIYVFLPLGLLLLK